MSDQTFQLPFKKPVGDPGLKDLLDLAIKNAMLNLSCHHIGTIRAFDAENQTASVTINYKKAYSQRNPKTGIYSVVLQDYPVMADCPVICLGGGKGSLTFPIAVGDECVVMFNDRDMDNWFQGATGGSVATPRLHSFSDAVILVGIRSLANVLENYDTTRAALTFGTTKVAAGNSKVLLKNATNGALGPSMTAFLTALTAFMTACEGSATDPTLVAAATAFMAAMAVPVAPTATGPIVNIEGILE